MGQRAAAGRAGRGRPAATAPAGAAARAPRPATARAGPAAASEGRARSARGRHRHRTREKSASSRRRRNASCRPNRTGANASARNRPSRRRKSASRRKRRSARKEQQQQREKAQREKEQQQQREKEQREKERREQQEKLEKQQAEKERQEQLQKKQAEDKRKAEEKRKAEAAEAKRLEALRQGEPAPHAGPGGCHRRRNRHRQCPAQLRPVGQLRRQGRGQGAAEHRLSGRHLRQPAHRSGSASLARRHHRGHPRHQVQRQQVLGRRRGARAREKPTPCRATWTAACPRRWSSASAPRTDPRQPAPHPGRPAWQGHHQRTKPAGRGLCSSRFSRAAGAPCGAPSSSFPGHSRRSIRRLIRSASSVQTTPDSRYTLTAISPNLAERPRATSGANAAPTSQARSADSAAPV